jgi:hypothetical protein
MDIFDDDRRPLEKNHTCRVNKKLLKICKNRLLDMLPQKNSGYEAHKLKQFAFKETHRINADEDKKN